MVYPSDNAPRMPTMAMVFVFRASMSSDPQNGVHDGGP